MSNPWNAGPDELSTDRPMDEPARPDPWHHDERKYCRECDGTTVHGVRESGVKVCLGCGLRT